jgi:broad specificity phosphatase PhoE
MSVYFVSPGVKMYKTIETFESKNLRFDAILSSTRRDCIGAAVAVYQNIPTRVEPLVTDLLRPRGRGRVREPISSLKVDYPEIDFDGRDEDCMWGVDPGDESREEFKTRVSNALRFAKESSVGGPVAVMASVSVINAYADVTLEPGEYFNQEEYNEYYRVAAIEMEDWRATSMSPISHISSE